MGTIACKDVQNVPSEPPEHAEGASETAQRDEASAVEAGEDVSTPKARISFISGAKSRRRRAVDWTRTNAKKVVTWVVLAFIASLAIPALTKQWNDRRQELQVKESLVTDVSKASAAAVYGAVAAVSKKGERQRAMRGALVSTWLRDRAALGPRFQVYFDRSEAASHWFGRGSLAPNLLGFPDTGFKDALFRYVNLACCDRANRGTHLGRLQVYLAVVTTNVAPEGRVWDTLNCGPQEDCDVDIKVYRHNYRWLGDTLLKQRENMIDQLLAANGEGFSSGWGDFISDLKPVR
jgi:hypothetical protein